MHHRSLLLLPPLLACALGCGGGDESPPADAGSDAGATVDAGTCHATATDVPEPVSGRCEAQIVDEQAVLPAGDDGEGGVITPGARRLTRVGDTVTMAHFPMAVAPIPGTSFVVVSTGGIEEHELAVVDLDTLERVDQHVYVESTGQALFLGLAISSDGTRLWASGGGANRVWAFDVDPATGQITPAPARTLTIAGEVSDGYVAGLALTSDDSTLIANLLFGDQLVMYDTSDGSEIRRVPMESGTFPYAVELTPDDATAFVSLWNGFAVVPVDVATGEVGAEIPVGKNPEGMALSPDGSTLVVASSDSDSLDVIDVGTRTVIDRVWVTGESAPRGASPTSGSFDDTGRLYVVNAGDNAVDVFRPSGTGFSRVGRIPSMWYPTDVEVLEDGTVVVLNGKHVGTGPNTDPGVTDILDLLGGSLTVIAPGELTDTALADWEIEVSANNSRATRFEEVSCPDGSDYDFPVPRPGEGPSTVIDHVILVVRENKTYDAYFGNLTLEDGTPHGNGDPALTLVPPGEIAEVIPNTQQLARDFVVGDNYYSLAEQSVQGHFLTTTGRTTDFVERSWLTTWGRGYWRFPPQGVNDPLGYPEEGSVFDWLDANGVSVDNFGEIVGSRTVAPHPGFPGLVYNMNVPDAEKVEWVNAQLQDRCRLARFTYILLPNDHTYGRRPGFQTPRSMMADNDEAVGMLIDGLSHSTHWPSSVVFVIEDDPQNGGDHVDNHRSPLLIVSPWAKRGHVASVHYNEASLYRTIQLILGVDEPLNAHWANASPMYDAFTSTPDFTPWEHIPRRWPEEVNPGDGSEMAAISQAWDFSEPDQQPGMSRLLWRHLRGTDPPWPILPEVVLEALQEQAEEEED